MKTIMTKKLPILLFVASLISCQQSDEPIAPDASTMVPLQLNSGIMTSVTRAYNSSWQANDEIGVFTTGVGTKTVTHSGNYEDANIPYKTETLKETVSGGTEGNYTYDPSSFLAVDKKIYLPANGAAVDVYAYYPYDADYTAENKKTVTIRTTQTGENQKTTDLLKAKYLSSAQGNSAIYRDNPTVNLQFSHCLSKALVRVVVGTGYGNNDLEGISVKFTHQPTSAKFDPLEQTLTISDGFSDVTACQLTGDATEANADNDGGEDYNKYKTISNVEARYVFRAILLPNTSGDGTNPATTAESGTRQLVFTVGSVTYTYNIGETFAEGQQTIYTLTLAATGITLTASITPWSHATPVEPINPLYPDE